MADKLKVTQTLKNVMGFSDAEANLVVTNQFMWGQVSQFLDNNKGRFATFSDPNSVAANGNRTQITIGKGSNSSTDKVRTLGHELGHALFHKEQFNDIKTFKSADSYADSRAIGEGYAILNEYKWYKLTSQKIAPVYDVENEKNFNKTQINFITQIETWKKQNLSDESIVKLLAKYNSNMTPNGVPDLTYGQYARWQWLADGSKTSLVADRAELKLPTTTGQEIKTLTKFKLYGDESNNVIDGEKLAPEMKIGLFMYGNSGNDTIYGNNYNDTILGGLGNDTLSGRNGNDILGGNAGIDTIYGGAGNDTLYGGVGNDILYGDNVKSLDKLLTYNDLLDGGAGLDKLFGGAGFDTYRFHKKDLNTKEIDIIEDSDGKGRIEVDGIKLDTLKWGMTTANNWKSADGQFTLKLVKTDLTVFTKIGNSMIETAVIKDFQNGELGLNLPSKAQARSVDEFSYRDSSHSSVSFDESNSYLIL